MPLSISSSSIIRKSLSSHIKHSKNPPLLYHYKMGTVMSSPWFPHEIERYSLCIIPLIRSSAPPKFIILHHQEESFQSHKEKPKNPPLLYHYKIETVSSSARFLHQIQRFLLWIIVLIRSNARLKF